MAHYLVIGGAGFIGSHLVEHLLAARHQVTVIDNFSTGKRENLSADPKLVVLEADIFELTANQLSGRFDGVVHLAALASVNDSWNDVLGAHELNLTATVRLIELVKQVNIPRFVFASSAAVYGNPHEIPITEEHDTVPLSPYGLQKLASEYYGRLFAQDNQMSFVALRFFNVFGPRQVTTSPYSGVITKFSARMRAGQPVTIYGDGSQTRDFVHVRDIARGIAQALVAFGLGQFTVCNLGTGRAVSIRELVEIIGSFFPSWDGRLESAPARPGDILNSQADISAARRLLGYDPAHLLEAGLAAIVHSNQ